MSDARLTVQMPRPSGRQLDLFIFALRQIGGPPQPGRCGIRVGFRFGRDSCVEQKRQRRKPELNLLHVAKNVLRGS